MISVELQLIRFKSLFSTRQYLLKGVTFMLSLLRFSASIDMRFGGSCLGADGYFFADDRVEVDMLFLGVAFILQ